MDKIHGSGTKFMQPSFSGPVKTLFDEWLPEEATPAGYAALIHAYGLEVTIPWTRSATSSRNRDYEQDGWRILTHRHAADPSLFGHLTFALKYEGIDLFVLKRLFQATGAKPIEAILKDAPSSAYSRRIGFLYEWLMEEQLNVPASVEGRYVEVIDTDLQFAGAGTSSRRFRLKDNMPGTRAFCPLVRKTEALRDMASSRLDQRAAEVISKVSPDILRRAAAFLLLEDTKSTFEIEGERPGHDRVRRWGQAVAQAGRHPISIDELERLQRIVLEGNASVKLGLRMEEGFIGQHDRSTHEPIPSHISARAEDVRGLVEGLVSYGNTTSGHMSPIVAAATLSFGFVFIHPFVDGNGRLHRYLIHHVLAQTRFSPKGLVFPVSSVMVEEIDAYRAALESYSARILPLIKWRPTGNGNVTIDNDTADLYRYFDATVQTEFLSHCVIRTIEQDLPSEVRYLEAHDMFKASVKRVMDIEDRVEELAFSFLQNGSGKFSKRARTRELAELGDERLDVLEELYANAFATSAEKDEDASPAGDHPAHRKL